jgi:hypothetical protein
VLIDQGILKEQLLTSLHPHKLKKVKDLKNEWLCDASICSGRCKSGFVNYGDYTIHT